MQFKKLVPLFLCLFLITSSAWGQTEKPYDERIFFSQEVTNKTTVKITSELNKISIPFNYSHISTMPEKNPSIFSTLPEKSTILYDRSMVDIIGSGVSGALMGGFIGFLVSQFKIPNPNPYEPSKPVSFYVLNGVYIGALVGIIFPSFF